MLPTYVMYLLFIFYKENSIRKKYMLTVMFIDEELLIKSKYKKGKEGC